jgi:hypothetical protein
MKTTHISALFGLGIFAILLGMELIQPPTPIAIDPQARNTVDRELVRFHGLPIGAGEAAVRTAFGPPDRVYTDINDYTGNSEVWVYGRSEVSFHDDDGGYGTFDIKDARYPVKIGTLTLRVGESAAPLATAFPISWRNRRPDRDTGNFWLALPIDDSDVALLLVEIDGDGKIVRIASAVQRV